MWAEQNKYKNQFLQMQLKHLKPREINEMTKNEILKIQNMPGVCNILSRSNVVGKSSLYFEDRAVLAYGFEALAKLMKELGSDDYLTQWKAINSLKEYIVNPLNAQRAIQHYDIVRRCQNVFLRIRLKYHKVKYTETSSLLSIFYYIALHSNGAQQISERYRLLDELYMIIKERKEHLQAISKILPLLSQNKENCLKLIQEYKVYDKLIDIWLKDPCVSYYPNDLWLHLSHLINLAPDEAVNKGFFELLYQRIVGKLTQYHIWDMKCFALLLRCPQGQQRFLEKDGLKVLYEILQHENLDNYENIVFCLMQALFTKAILWRCREFTNLPLIITKLAEKSENFTQQLFCLQALREMGVMPCIKRFIKINCLKSIKELKCQTVINEKERNEIIYWLEREIFHTKNLL